MSASSRRESSLAALGVEPTDETLLREQFRVLTRQIPALYCILLLSSATLAYSAAVTVSVTTAYLYPAVVMPLVGARLIVWMRRRNQPIIADTAKLKAMLRLTLVLTILLALGLGAWGAVLVDRATGIERAFTPIYISMGAIACGYCLSTMPIAAYLTIILAVVPPSAVLIAQGEGLLAIVGGNILLICALVMWLILGQYHQFVDNVRLSRGEVGRAEP